MGVVGGSPPVDIVILGTNWCWHAGTDNEAHLSYCKVTDGIITWHACMYWFGLLYLTNNTLCPIF